ncbi:ABC transporter substrate-binding protein, partial [Streptomyces nojiriensis]
MLSSSARRGAAVLLSAAVLTTLSACGAAPDQKSGGADGAKSVQPGAATSVADFGSVEALAAAAQKEGELNVIALPPDWANYGEIIKAFEAKYKLTVNSDNPAASRLDEIAAVPS